MRVDGRWPALSTSTYPHCRARGILPKKGTGFCLFPFPIFCCCHSILAAAAAAWSTKHICPLSFLRVTASIYSTILSVSILTSCSSKRMCNCYATHKRLGQAPPVISYAFFLFSMGSLLKFSYFPLTTPAFPFALLIKFSDSQ
ncbi:hypothetical protein BX070DRAFT_222385 [Coemansia spiralis]|nr:hypothetical protein BX070DRAFT_222385 [Coemansia spiralis]